METYTKNKDGLMTRMMNTAELAKTLGVQSATIRRAVCVSGHYLGLRPVKLPNSRLAWHEEELRRVIEKATGGAAL